MLKKICSFLALSVLILSISGCGAIIGAALSAAVGYGIYQATKK